jgi:hypothetical protein
MEYRTGEELQRIADLLPDTERITGLSRSERLARWAWLLQRNPHRDLRTLRGIEFMSDEARDQMRCDGSALSVAFEDRVFRVEGLRDDSYGEAKLFFGLSDRQLHRALCYCHFGPTAKAARVGRQIAALANGPGAGFFARIRSAFRGA